jgi:predicted nucleic acid-binding protein
MIIVDTSAWIEYLKDGIPHVVKKVDLCLEQDLVGIGDLVYCEIMQGIRSPRERSQVSSLLLSLPQFNMVGFNMVGFSIAEKSAANYRLLRSKGITVRKTIDVLIGTFCAEHGLQIIHHDSDFDLMAKHIGLKIL